MVIKSLISSIMNAKQKSVFAVFGMRQHWSQPITQQSQGGHFIAGPLTWFLYIFFEKLKCHKRGKKKICNIKICKEFQVSAVWSAVFFFLQYPEWSLVKNGRQPFCYTGIQFLSPLHPILLITILCTCQSKLESRCH